MDHVDQNEMKAVEEKLQDEEINDAHAEMMDTIVDAIKRFEDKTGETLGEIKGYPEEPVESEFETLGAYITHFTW